MGLLGGTIVVLALLISPVGATGLKHVHHGAGRAVHFACRHCHHQFASERDRTSLRSQRRVRQTFAMADRERSAWRRERVYGQHRWQNATTLHARYQPYGAAMETRREESFAENNRVSTITARLNRDQLARIRERDAYDVPVTARLNLDQLRIARERDSEIAQWESQYGTTPRT